MNPNYSKALEKEIERIDREGTVPTLLLHSCCAPCSSYVMEYLREYFAITVFYYNPNITAGEEYRYRLAEEKRLIEAYNKQVDEQDFDGMHSTSRAHKIAILEAPYDPERYLSLVKGYVQHLLRNAAPGVGQSGKRGRIRLLYNHPDHQSLKERAEAQSDWRGRRPGIWGHVPSL